MSRARVRARAGWMAGALMIALMAGCGDDDASPGERPQSRTEPATTKTKASAGLRRRCLEVRSRAPRPTGRPDDRQGLALQASAQGALVRALEAGRVRRAGPEAATLLKAHQVLSTALVQAVTSDTGAEPGGRLQIASLRRGARAAAKAAGLPECGPLPLSPPASP